MPGSNTQLFAASIVLHTLTQHEFLLRACHVEEVSEARQQLAMLISAVRIFAGPLYCPDLAPSVSTVNEQMLWQMSPV